MIKKNIETNLGKIAVVIDDNGGDTPIVFMHGLFLDNTVWTNYDSSLTGRTHVYLDMPGHGNSSDIGKDWCLDDCVSMLMSVLDQLNIKQCIAIGQSWGSMTALRAASKFPESFQTLGLFNMPFKRTLGFKRLGFNFQKLIVRFPRFYAGKAAESLYSPEILQQKPELATTMADRLARRPAKEIARFINAVILNAEDTTHLLYQLKVPALAVVGESDYVGIPPRIKTIVVPGGHIVPHESPKETSQAIQRIVELAVNQ